MKINREKHKQIMGLYKQGKSYKQICDAAKVTTKTVYNLLNDRAKCQICKYRAGTEAVNNCDYILIKGERRGCSVKDCTKFEEGPRVLTHKQQYTMY